MASARSAAASSSSPAHSSHVAPSFSAAAETRLQKCVIAGQVEYRDYPCDNVPMKPGVSSWQWQQGLALPDTSIAPPAPQPYVARDPNAEWNNYVTYRVEQMRRREFIASRPSWGWNRGRW